MQKGLNWIPIQAKRRLSLGNLLGGSPIREKLVNMRDTMTRKKALRNNKTIILFYAWNRPKKEQVAGVDLYTNLWAAISIMMKSISDMLEPVTQMGNKR